MADLTLFLARPPFYTMLFLMQKHTHFFVGGYCLALDMTARDFQNEAKAKGHPWTLAKVGL